MRVLLDACVLYPTVLRALLMRRAGAGGFVPLVSERILLEWRHAAARDGGVDPEAEIAAYRATGVDVVAPGAATEAQLALPDPNDVHVLAAAIDGNADELLTFNSRDFPTNALAAHGILRRHPDEFLLEQLHANPDAVRAEVATTLAEAAGHGIAISAPRALMKRARLPRFGKALFQA